MASHNYVLVLEAATNTDSGIKEIDDKQNISNSTIIQIHTKTRSRRK